MGNISASLVKELRDKTGAGMMDCKKALATADGDIEKAIDNLRKNGIAKAEKKSGRATTEGKIISHIDGTKGVLLEVLCETDFVATNDKFTEFVKGVAERAVKLDADGDISNTVNENEKDNIVSMIATIGENMQLRRAVKWESDGNKGAYLHQGGRIGVMVDVEGDADADFLNDLCMHIAAFNPDYITPDGIPTEVIEKEKEIAKAQLKGKPENIIENILKGKLNKWYTQVCLVKQPWIRDDKSSMEKVNPEATVKRFLRWEVGEEI
jgi:elongation factor Ts